MATANGEDVYSFELDMAEAAADFRKQSGTYEMVGASHFLVRVCVCVCACV